MNSISHTPYHWFERFGIKIVYTIVDQETLAIRPIADELIHAVCGSFHNETIQGKIAWSNELTLHHLEMKNAEPAGSFTGLAPLFLESVQRANSILAGLNAQLLSGGMHPFMNPRSETRIWPHQGNKRYRTIDTIFSCNRHGWANLQGTSVNLSFAGDDEFGRLLAAIRLVLPIIPALSASSPIVENTVTGFLATRLESYRTSAMHIPSITGDVIPEPVFTKDEYIGKILEPIHRDLQPLDPQRMLAAGRLNARGAIARFERNAIEMTIVDTQETPRADIAIAAAVIGVVRLLAQEVLSSFDRQKLWAVDPLKKILLDTIKTGERAVITNGDYLTTLGFPVNGCTAGELWKHLISLARKHDDAFINPHSDTLSHITEKGTLATRILRELGSDRSWKKIDQIYRAMGEHLVSGTMVEEKAVFSIGR